MAGTMSEILSRFKKDIKNSFQAQKNIVDVTEKYIGLLENAEGGGSVEVTQIVSSGTKIASIKVNDVTTDLYAPKNSEDYSGTETAIGTWSDNEILYRKNFPFSDITLTSGQNAKIGEFSEAISLKIAIGTCTEGSTTVTLPERSMSIQYSSNELKLAATDSWSNISGEIVAYYTKPTI